MRQVGGLVLAGRYRIGDEIGRGGQSRVYAGEDLLYGTPIVVKTAEAGSTEHLEREYDLLGEIAHPNIVQVLDLIEEQKQLFLVQSQARGPGFTEWAKQHGSPQSLCRAVAAVGRALQLLHAVDIIHADLKPSNLRVSPEDIGRLPGVCLIDFGLGRRRMAEPAQDPAGTIGYAAPEVLAGGQVTPAADLYSLGAVLHEALFGRLPVASLDPATSVEVPALTGAPALRELLGDLLQSDPTLRPDARSLLRGLGEVVGEDLRVDVEELQGPYFPNPPLVGRQDALSRLGARLDQLVEGKPGILQLSGAGGSSIAAAAHRMAHLRRVEVVGGAEALRHLEEAEPVHQAARLLDGWIERSRGRPLLVDFDDCDSADLLVREVVTQYSRTLDGDDAGHCLMLWTGSEEHAWAGADVIELERLSDEQVRQLVNLMLHGCDVPWIDQLEEQSHGDPRWITELVRAQIEAGLPQQLVSEVRQLSAMRIDSLTQQQRQLLSLIAFGRRPLPAEVITQIIEHGDELATLHARGLLTTNRQGVYLSRPSLARLARALVSNRQARAIHQRLLDAWRRQEPTNAAAIIHHQLRCENFSTEILRSPHLDKADLAWAADQLCPSERREDAERWVMLKAQLGRIERAAGHTDEALALADEIAAFDEVEAQLLRAEILLEGGQPSQVEQVLASVNSVSARQRLLAARAAFLLGDFEAAERHATFEDVDDKTTDQTTDVLLSHLAGLSAVYRGEPRRGLDAIERSEARARAQQLVTPLPRILNSKGIAQQRLGLLAEAVDTLAEALLHARRGGDLRLAASAALNLGTLEQRRGKLASALASYRQAGLAASRAGIGTTHASALFNEANLLLLFGDEPAASSCIARALEIAEQAGAQSVVGHALLYQAEAALRRGDGALAADTLRRARRCFAAADRSGADAADLLSCEIDLSCGAVKESRETASALLQRMSADDPDRWRAHLRLARAMLADAETDGEAVVAELELALAHGRRCATIDRAWECHAMLANCLADDRLSASYHARRFVDTIEALRQRVPAEYRQLFDGREDVQRARAMVTTASTDNEDENNPQLAEVMRLLEINKELNRRLPTEELLARILDSAIALIGAERGFVLEQRSQKLRITASRNVDKESVRRGMHKFSRSIAETAMSQQRPVVAADALADDRFAEQLSVHGLKLRAVICVPLRVEQQVRGALYLDNRFRAGAFSAAHSRLLQAFADQAGIALYNAGLLEESDRHRDALAEAKAELDVANQKLHQQVARQSQQLSEISQRLRSNEEALIRRYNAANIVGRSKPMRDLFAQIGRVSEADVPVFICGESGTGKELVARAIHFHGPRQAEPFVTINCAAIPPSLLESELFGHVRGAFTGALRDRPGLFEAAGKGTLLLDEIGDMAIEMQAKLLRILQEGNFRRVGDSQLRNSSCRVLSAGQVPLDQLVAQGRFREDLMYRLNVVQLTVPALRERAEDIPLLVEHIVGQLEPPRTVTPAAMAALMDFDWPGNVRQLVNELQRAGVLSDDRIDRSSLSATLAKSSLPGQSSGQGDLNEALRAYERRLILSALRDAGSNVTEAARRLGVSRVVLHRKINKLGIRREKPSR